MWSQAGTRHKRRRLHSSDEGAPAEAHARDGAQGRARTDDDTPCTRVGLRGIRERNFDLLPILARDPHTRVSWVRVRAADEPLALLAEMLGFPLLLDDRAESERLAGDEEEVDVIIVRGMGAAGEGEASGDEAASRMAHASTHAPTHASTHASAHASAHADSGNRGARRTAVRPRLLLESELRGLIDDGALRWERAIDSHE